MEDLGYKVEYVPPKDNCAILQGLFEKVLEGIIRALPEGAIDQTPLKVTREKNYYRCQIVLNDRKGQISLGYDDCIPEFDSFEEYMHSGSGDRGTLDIAVIINVSLPEGEKCESELKRIGDKVFPDVSYRGKKDHGEIYASRSIGIYLLSPDESDVKFISGSILDLWNQIITLKDSPRNQQRS